MLRWSLFWFAWSLIPSHLFAIQENQANIEFFERKVRPVLSKHCYACHSASAKTLHASLRLDSKRGLATGGDSGELIDANNPLRSLLLEVLRYDGDIQMPPKGKLPEKDIVAISQWIKNGAVIPEESSQPERTEGKIDFKKGRRHWAFLPARTQALPKVDLTKWPRRRMDYFVLKRLENKALSPAPPAEPAVLIRRLFFDVIGLPPTPEQVNRFEENPTEAAYRDLVNELLESPQYGEKWGRMWLDLARYTDKTASWLYKSDQAHLYRDWIVRAFNEDMPYDEFVHRQLATDLMDRTGLEDLPALGFISLGPTYWKELKLPSEIIKTIVADEWEERVDAVSRTFLGLTVACARCHDHKFDPISAKDYYAMAGVFASSRQVERPMIAEKLYTPVQHAKVKIAQLEKKLAEAQKKKPADSAEIDSINAEIVSLRNTPYFGTPLVSSLAEESLYVMRKGKKADQGTVLDYRSEPRDLPLFIRGNPNRPGPLVPRGFLTVLSRSTPPAPFRIGSGRLELARAITNDAASLAARVIVNRIWRTHFGKGLVNTPSNFGNQGSRPSHPQLLDDLAARFIRNGWSIKQLHREILLSATWRQSTLPDQKKLESDPQNRLLSRMNRRKLDFEEWRDALLSATGMIDLRVGGRSMDLSNPKNFRRTLYATVHRRDMSITLRMHDFPDPTQHSPKRSATVTPLQGLFALNGPLLNQQADFLVSRLEKEASDDTSKITRAYQLLYARNPTEREAKLGLHFLGDEDAGRGSRWSQYVHVLLAGNELMWVD